MQALRDFIEHRLWVVTEGRRIKVRLIDEQVRLLDKCFYGKIHKAILWKNRGGGGSLLAALIMWMKLVFHSQSFVDMAGSGEQAEAVYEYTKDFWNCIPELKKYLDGDTLMSKTKLTNGSYIKCIANSQTAARGKHPGGFIGDESCQKEKGKDDNLKAAIQMVLNHEEFLILLLSTFHHPTGFFQEHWDGAAEKGYDKFKWDCIDTMMQCDLDIDCKKCYLTDRHETIAPDGRLMITYSGCNGRGRTSQGYISVDNVMEAKRTNDRHTWETEHLCTRPSTAGKVFDPDDVTEAFSYIDFPMYEPDEHLQAVGIDWGFAGQCAVIGPITLGHCKDIDPPYYIGIQREAYFTEKGMDTIIEYLKLLEKEEGKFIIMPDSSHQFENYELANAGFTVFQDAKDKGTNKAGVKFGVWKKWGYGNLKKCTENKRLRVSAKCVQLKRQMEGLRTDDNGDIIKADDHGPDALMCGMLQFDYIQLFAQEGDMPDMAGGKGDEKSGGDDGSTTII